MVFAFSASALALTKTDSIESIITVAKHVELTLRKSRLEINLVDGNVDGSDDTGGIVSTNTPITAVVETTRFGVDDSVRSDSINSFFAYTSTLGASTKTLTPGENHRIVAGPGDLEWHLGLESKKPDDLKWHDLLAGQYRSTVTLTISSAE